MLPRFDVDGVPQVASVLAVGSCHDARSVCRSAPGPGPRLNARKESAPARVPIISGGWAEKLPSAANQRDSPVETDG